MEDDPFFLSSIIWSDEVFVRLKEFNAQKIYYSREKRTDCYIQKSQSLGKGRMFWGCFSFHGKGPLTVVVGKIDRFKYCKMLEEVFIPEWEAAKRIFRPVFMQDNARPHDCEYTRNYLNRHNVEILKWPACSPDLNPIEDVWAILKGRVRKLGRPTKIIDLENIILQEWENFDISTLEALSMSFQERLERIIEIDGNLINKFYL